jgi:hypothetical protein
MPGDAVLRTVGRSVLLYCYTLQRKKAERIAQQNRLQDFFDRCPKVSRTQVS